MIDRVIYNLGRDAPNRPEMGTGWGSPTEIDNWTNAPVATLTLPTPARAVDHFIVLRMLIRPDMAEQRVRLSVRGTEVARFTVLDRVARAARISAALLAGGPSLPLTFHLDDDAIALGSIALQPDIDTPPGAPSDTDLSDRATMLRFESLGENCEFGLAQRAAGAEPLGLMRFASTNLQRLLVALDNGFDGLGVPDKLVVEVSENGREYMVADRVYGLHYHAWVKTGEMSAEDVHRREVRRMPFLIRKLSEDLETGHKIFVRKERGGELDSIVYPLLPALRRWGPNTLLYVKLADAAHPPGLVERREPGLLIGYIERFAPGENAHDFLADQWLTLCHTAQTLVWPELIPAPEVPHAAPETAPETAPPPSPEPAPMPPPPLAAPQLAPTLSRPALSCRLALRLQNGGYVDSGGPNQSYANLHHLEAAPYWVRLIMFNDQPEPHRIEGAAVAATSAVGDEVTPTDPGSLQPWRRVTFNAGGGDSEPLDAPGGTAFALSLPGSPHGAIRPVRMLSDWVPLAGLERSDGGSGALLMVRSFTAGRQRYSGCAGRPDPATGRLHAGYWAAGDATQADWHGPWHRFDGLFASYGLQYITAMPGASLVGIGDSIMHGSASTGQLSSFGMRACALASRAGLPVSWFNEGYIGRRSRDYAQAGLWAIETLKPQLTLIQTWSENDPHTIEAAEAALARAVALGDATRRHGGVPILVTAAPVFGSNVTAEVARQASLARVRALGRAGIAVLDLDAIWGSGRTPNSYHPAFDSGDHRHQNDAACAAAADVLAGLLRDVLGMG